MDSGGFWIFRRDSKFNTQTDLDYFITSDLNVPFVRRAATNSRCVRATVLSKDMYWPKEEKKRVRYTLRLNISISVGFYRSDEFYFRHKINLREGRARDIISSGGKKWPSNGAVNAPFGQNKCYVRLLMDIDRALFSGRIFPPRLRATNVESKRCRGRVNVSERRESIQAHAH